MFYLGLTNLLFFLRYAFAGQGRLTLTFYYPILLLLFLFSGFRYQVGCDWSGYYNQFTTAADMTWFVLIAIGEPLWWITLAILNEANLPYPLVNVVSSGIFFMGIHQLARRQPNPLSFLVLLFPVLIVNIPMSAIRQGAALGLMCIAFVHYADRRPLRYTIWVVLAAGFHSSALIFLLLTPMIDGRVSRAGRLLILVMLVPGLYFLVSGRIAEVVIGRYIDSDVEAAGAVFRVAMLLLSAGLFALIARRRWRRLWPADYQLAVIGALGMVAMVTILPVNTVIADRIGYYFIPLQAMIFARLPYLQMGRYSQIYSFLPYAGLVFVFAAWALLSWHFQQCYVPYQTWLFGFPNGDPIGI